MSERRVIPEFYFARLTSKKRLAELILFNKSNGLFGW